MTTLTRATPKPVTRGELAALRREINAQEAATLREVASEWTRPGIDPAWIERADAKYRKRRARYLLREAKR